MSTKNVSRFALLGLLALEPMSGYDLKKFIDEAIRFFWNMSYGTIYPMLKRMEAEGLVSKERMSQQNRPEKVIYSITDKGRELLEEWQKGDVELPKVNNEVLLRLFTGQDLSVEGNIDLIEKYREKLIKRTEHYSAIDSECLQDANDSFHGTLIYATLRCGILTEQARIHWCEETITALQECRKNSNTGEVNEVE